MNFDNMSQLFTDELTILHMTITSTFVNFTLQLQVRGGSLNAQVFRTGREYWTHGL